MTANKSSRKKFSVWGLFHAAGCIGCLLTVLGFGGGLDWRLDLLSHFRMQYLVCSAIWAGAALVRHHFRWGIVYAVCVVVNLVVVAPLFWRDTGRPPDDATQFRLMLSNVHTRNTRYDLVTQAIRESKADVVVLQEINEAWRAQISELQGLYRHIVADPREDNFGIALLSKFPLKQADIAYFGDTEVSSIISEFTVGGKPVRVLATHPVPPVGQQATALRNGQLTAISEYLVRRASLNRATVVVGDLNATPWSLAFQQFLQQSGLNDSTRGFGFQPTWPTSRFFMRIPIDHCLISPQLAVVKRTVGPDVGSDHYPVIIDLAFTGQ